MAHILVVDDDPDILKLSQKVLASEGHVVLTAEDAMKAMDLLHSARFDLMISDANMPHYSGFDLIQTIRRDQQYDHMAIAMLTGLRDRKDIEKAIHAGVDDYIVKPIDPLILGQKVKSLFDKKPPERHLEYVFSQNSGMVEAEVRVRSQLKSISEFGIVIETSAEMKVGAIVNLHCEFFTQHNLQTPPMKVIQVIRSGDSWSVHLLFLGAREAVLQKIRGWIFSHSGSNSRKVA